MVYNRRSAAGAKTATPKGKGKKSFEAPVEDEMDSSDGEMPMQRTPANKKNRQSLSEKKVSFQIPGKNTPNAKTPKKELVLSGKKATPAKGKSKVQEFKGMKTAKQGKQEEEDDDSDDDEEDEDFEADLDEEDDLDLDLDDDDDDDDEEEDDDEVDDDDEEEEEDDDDDEEEDDKIKVKLQLANLQQKNELNKQKTPVKAKAAETPKKGGQTPKSDIKKENADSNVHFQKENERRHLRDARMLYLGNLPKDVAAEELKVLSGEIEDVILPNRSGRSAYAFAFLVFPSEAIAVSSYDVLKTKKFRGQLLKLDFVGEKSLNKKPGQESNRINLYNMKKLFVTGIPVDATIAQVAQFFPLANQISLNSSPLYRTATIVYDKEETANAEFESNKEIEISGQKLIVLHSMVGKSQVKRKQNRKRGSSGGKSNGTKQGGNPAKKMKVVKDESDD